MAILLNGKLYVKSFSMLYVDCYGHVVFIVKMYSYQLAMDLLDDE